MLEKNSKLLITGGTGSFGNAVLKGFLDSDIKEIRIFSRDEKKQDDMRKIYNNPKVKFYLGDVRDINSIESAVSGVDYIFHAAALKQVPSCEFYPMQALKTNVIGTENILKTSIKYNVKKIICLSTDKAVYPINAMGMSKALMEKVMVATSRQMIDSKSRVCGTRYGNVMASRGSVIPLFINQIINKQPITITDPSMTRFMMTLEDAIDLVFYAFKNGKNGDIFVQKSPASTVETVAKSLVELLGENPDYPINIIGTRHGEKLYETLLSKEEMAIADDLGKYYRIPSDNRDLNYSKYIEKGKKEITKTNHKEDYNSNNTNRLNIEETKKLLLKLEIVRNNIK